MYSQVLLFISTFQGVQVTQIDCHSLILSDTFLVNFHEVIHDKTFDDLIHTSQANSEIDSFV